MDEQRNSEAIQIKGNDALIVVDLQNDFCPPDGALAVPGGNQIVSPINRLLEAFPLTVSTQDWHPKDHYSFEEEGGEWPKHCLQGEWGAKLHPDLEKNKIDFKLKKGQDPQNQEDYRGLSATDDAGRNLAEILNENQVERLFACGLALDYCVKETALDGLSKGYQLFLIEDCTRPVKKEAGGKAKEEIRREGGTLIEKRKIEF